MRFVLSKAKPLGWLYNAVSAIPFTSPDTEEEPEKKEQPRVAPEDNTPAGRGQRFSTAKENGESTVTINGKTYNTADFKEDGKYWTNDKTGESFLRY